MIKKIYSKLYSHIFYRGIIDFVGYEYFISLIKNYKLYRLEGDFCEIGAFCGGGTYKLAKYAKKFNKKVYACDIFDYTFDKNTNTSNNRMSDLYEENLKGKNQKEVFLKTIKPVREVVIVKKGDSKNLEIDSKLCFSFIDGYHSYDYVISDFEKVFPNTVLWGLIGFHDYGFDLPEVTKGINSLVGKYKDKIKIIDINLEKHTIFFKKIKI
jgi:hypothetical protein